VGGYSDILAAQRLWSSFLMGVNGGRGIPLLVYNLTCRSSQRQPLDAI
jgi:hypothetical protein